MSNCGCTDKPEPKPKRTKPTSVPSVPRRDERDLAQLIAEIDKLIGGVRITCPGM
jgi:hypothetical protein